MTTTVVALLNNPLTNFSNEFDGEQPTTVNKAWTDVFDIRKRWVIVARDQNSFSQVFGPLHEADRVRLGRTTHEIEYLQEVGEVEAEVHNHFSVYVARVIRLAFTNSIDVRFDAAPHGPPPGAPPDMRVSVEFQMPATGEAVAIGLIKRPGIIVPAHWQTPRVAKMKTLMLAQELIG